MWRTLAALLSLVIALLLIFIGIPALASRSFGPPASSLSLPQVVQYSAKVLWADGLLTRHADPDALEKEFVVEPGESVDSVCRRLQQDGLVLDGQALRNFLIYSGRDTSVQAGRYQLSAAMSAMEVSSQLQDATPTDVELIVLAGWRLEEIAATLPTSGLHVSPEEFVAAAQEQHSGYEFLSGAATSEGFLFPDAYILPRAIRVDELLETLIRNFAQHLEPVLREGFAAQGLSVQQAVTLASIVQRESVREEEAALIASVYLNRMRAGMRLDADPTVQYALGFNAIQQTWWTNPLSLADLKVESPYNTYLVVGLPPAPISNPGMAMLQAVAAPAESTYFFFNARCDGTGYHQFAATFEEHLSNLCP